MDHILGIVGEDFVLVAADRKIAHSVLTLKNDQDKIIELDSSKVIAAGGEFGDIVQFTEFVKRNLQLYSLRNGYDLSTKAAAHFTRGEIARLIRSNPHMCNMLVAGVDGQGGPQLYWIDYLGCMQQVNCGAHGYGGYFSLSIMDRFYRKGMNKQEAIELMKKCFDEINTRFLIGGATFTMKIVDKTGVHIVE